MIPRRLSAGKVAIAAKRLIIARMEMKEIFGIAAIIVGLYGYVPYVRGMLKGQVHPHVFSWFVWAVVTWIVFAAQVSEGAGAGAWITGVTGFTCSAIAVFSLKIGERTITRSDWVFFLLALAAIPLWVATDNPLWSVILLSIIDVCAFVPTFRKSWHKPWSESLEAYLVAGSKFMLSVMALESLTLTTTFFQTTVILSNIVFCLMLLYRRRGIARPA